MAIHPLSDIGDTIDQFLREEKERKAEEIRQRKEELIILETAIALLKDEKRAVCIKVALNGGKFLEYWVDTNIRLLPGLLAEKRDLEQYLISHEG